MTGQPQDKPDKNSKDYLEKEELKAKIKKLNKECEALDNQSNVSKLSTKELLIKIDKLKKENEFLDHQLSKRSRLQESIKSYASLGTILTGLFAILTIGFSIYQFRSNSNLTSDAKKEDRLNSALANLSDTSVRKRLAGIIALRSFIKVGDSLKNSQALLSLTHSLSIENDPTIRNAIIEVFSSSEIKNNVDIVVLNDVLNSLISLNREIFKRWYSDLSTFFPKASHQSEVILLEAKEKSLATAITILLHRHIKTKDLSSLYLRGADLKNIYLPGADFSKSNLSYADFNYAQCDSCNFDKANILTTNFSHASLQRCKFIISGDRFQNNFITDYIEDSKFDKIYLGGTNFDYADLSGASFYNEPIFGVLSEKPYRYFGMSFNGANIHRADFSRVSMVSLVQQKDASDYNYYTSLGLAISVYGEHYTLMSFEPDHRIFMDYGKFNILLNFIGEEFKDSNWKDAKFPKGIMEYFKYHQP